MPAKDLAVEITNTFNDYNAGESAKIMAEHFVNVHPTIQQSLVRGMFVFLRKLAETEYYDARNEDAVKAARAAVKAIDEEKIYFSMV